MTIDYETYKALLIEAARLQDKLKEAEAILLALNDPGSDYPQELVNQYIEKHNLK